MRQKRKWFKKLSSYFDWFTKGTYIRELNDERYYTWKSFVIIKKHLIGQSTLHRIIQGPPGETPVYDTLMLDDITDAYEESDDRIELMALLSIQHRREYLWSFRHPFEEYKVKDTLVEDVRKDYAEYFI